MNFAFVYVSVYCKILYFIITKYTSALNPSTLNEAS